MAGNIKGITIEIGGDATPLDKALSSVTKRSKELQTDLNKVNKLLKLDPSNVELLAQKEELLARQVQTAAERLRILKEEQEKVNESFLKGEIGKETYQEFQREVISAEQKLNSLESQAKEFGDTAGRAFNDAANKASEFGSKAEAAGDKISTVSAIAAGALGVAAVQSASLETAAAKYTVATGESIDATERFEDVISGIYSAGWGDSFEQIASDMQQVKNLLGDMPDEQLQSVTEKAYMLQDTFDMDMNESIRGVQSLMDQFGMSADDAFELMYQGCQRGLNQNQDLADQVAEYSTYYADSGLSAQAFFDIMAAGAENGVYQIDYLNDAVKEFSIRMQDGSTTTSDALGQMGLDANKLTSDLAAGGEKGTAAFQTIVQSLAGVENDLERNQLGVALFGTKWEDTGEQAILALAGIEEAGNDVSLTLDEAMSAVGETSGAKTEKAFRELKTSLTGIGDVVMPVVATVASAVATIATSINNLPGPVQTVIATVLAIVAAAGPILIFVGKVASGIGAIIPLLARIGPAVQMAASLIGTGVNIIMPIISTVSMAVKGLFAILLANPIGLIVAAIAAVIAIGVTLYNKCEWFRTFWDGLWNSIKSIADIAIKAIVKFFTVTIPNGFNNCVQKVKQFVNNFVTKIKELPGKIKTQLTKLINNVKNFASDLIKRGKQAASDFVSRMVSLITGLPGKIKTQFNKAISNVKTFASNLVAKGKQAASDFLKKITSGLASLPGKMLEFGANVVRGFVNGIKNKIGAIAQACRDMVGALTGKVADLLGLRSPSRVLFEMGDNTGAGFVNGIIAKIAAVRSATKQMITAVTDTVSGSDAANINFRAAAAAIESAAGVVTGRTDASGQHGGGQAYDLTIPFYVAGRKITEIISRLQYDSTNGRLRAVGGHS